jgi:hypothetical protein
LLSQAPKSSRVFEGGSDDDQNVSETSVLKEKKYKKFFNSKKFQDENSKNNYLKHEMSNLSSLNERPRRELNLKFETTSALGKNSTKKPKSNIADKSSRVLPNKKFFLDSECTNNNNSTLQRNFLSDTCLNRKKSENMNSKSLEGFNVNKNGEKQLEIDDKFLIELNKNFENLINEDYADACIAIYYIKESHTILLEFYSLMNLSNYELKNVNVLIDVFHKDISKKRIFSKLKPVNIKALQESKFKHTFSIKLNKRVNIKALILNIYIIGEVFKEEFFEPEPDLNANNKTNILITSKSSLSDKQILGGAHIVVKNFL